MVGFSNVLVDSVKGGSRQGRLVICLTVEDDWSDSRKGGLPSQMRDLSPTTVEDDDVYGKASYCNGSSATIAMGVG